MAFWLESFLERLNVLRSCKCVQNRIRVFRIVEKCPGLYMDVRKIECSESYKSVSNYLNQTLHSRNTLFNRKKMVKKGYYGNEVFVYLGIV